MLSGVQCFKILQCCLSTATQVTPLWEYTLAPLKQWHCVPFLWKCETRDIEGWKGAAQCPGLATAQAWDATCTQPRTSGSSATQALYHGPTALLKKYRGASHNHNANPDCSSPHRAQGHYLMSRVDTFTSWVNSTNFQMWFAMQMLVDFHSSHPKAPKKTYADI